MGKIAKCPSRVTKKNGRSRFMKNLNKLRWGLSSAAETSSLGNSQFNMSTPDDQENLPPLEIEFDKSYQDISQKLIGRRIVNLGYVLKEYKNILLHSRKCTMGRMDFVKERRIGLNSELIFACSNCEKSSSIRTDGLCKDNELKDSLVWGSLSIGIGHSQCEELLGVMDIPCMAPSTFSKHTNEVKKNWDTFLMSEMKKAGEEEKRISIEKGNLTAEGMPFITVVADGGWSKRTYGHGFNSNSGVAVIIGAETKKPLHIGVRNKDCSFCQHQRKKGRAIKAHICAVNFSGHENSRSV